MAYSKDPMKGPVEEVPAHRIRITLTSRNVKSLEKVCADLKRKKLDSPLEILCYSCIYSLNCKKIYMFCKYYNNWCKRFNKIVSFTILPVPIRRILISAKYWTLFWLHEIHDCGATRSQLSFSVTFSSKCAATLETKLAQIGY